MKIPWSDIRWKPVLLAGIIPPVLSMIMVFLIVGVFAAGLAIQARGQPDQARINQFANQISPWVAPALAILLTVGAGLWVARRVEEMAQLHGLLTGLIVALIILILALVFGGPLNLTDALLFGLTLAAGWMGGWLGSREKSKA
jgi:putative membrane protein (TIGR04086 family)